MTRPRTKKTRLCLCCRRPFASTWVGHRVCDGCKHTSSWRGGGDFSMPARSNLIGGRRNGREAQP